MSEFAPRFQTFLDEFITHYPVHATNIGDHRVDGRWPDMTATGRAERLAFLDRWIDTLEALDGLGGDDAIDRDLLLGELAAHRFAATELRDDAWDPLDWVYLLGEGLFTLVARPFAPLADRLGSVAERLDGIPALLDSAVFALIGTDEQPVGRFQTETAIAQLAGIDELIEEALAEASAAGDAGDVTVVALQPRLEAAATTARTALEAFTTHLRDVVLPASEGDGRLGAERFARKMRHTMRSDELTPERILAGAEREFDVVRAEMVRIAGEIWPTWCPDRARPDDDGALVRGVLDAVAAEHPTADMLLDFCLEENALIEAFCRDRDLIGLADEPLEIQWTPKFLRSSGGAMLLAPGPLDRGLPTFFAITPMPDDWSAERKESNLREDNDRMLQLLTIHEAVPGHYLQGAYANRCPSLTRTVFSSGLFAEGWAVYVTQVMMDAGYRAHDPALLLNHWKLYLRCVTNAIIDARIHCHGMTEDEAVTFMIEGGFQEEAEARAKYGRARLSSTQLSTYYTGSMEMWAIELEARRRAAAAVGADPDAIVPRELPGGLGDTPGFRHRDHLEAVLSHGEPSTALLRRMLFD